MSDTPRSDAVVSERCYDWSDEADQRRALTDLARALERELAAVTAERDALRKWRTALEDACVNACLDIPDDPVAGIKALIAWECTIALDPAVSTDAQRLRDTYKEDGKRWRRHQLEMSPCTCVYTHSIKGGSSYIRCARCERLAAMDNPLGSVK